MEGKSKKAAVFVIIALVAAIGAGGGYYYKRLKDTKLREALEVNTIYNGITINGKDVGGLTKDEALELLKNELVYPMQNQVVTVLNEEESYNIKFDELGAEYDIDTAVDTAYEAARSGTLKDRYKLYEDIQNNGLEINLDIAYDEQKVNEKIEELDGIISREAKDSVMKRENGAFVITDEEIGYELDTERTKDSVVEILKTGKSGETKAFCEETLPKITKEENEMSTDLLGTFYTKYSGGPGLGRNINLDVGCKNIDGTILMPGEIFSMNESLGPQTYENGYRNAAVIVNGKIEDGLAGGVCQITTTLYNAVVRAELEIVERKNHSLAVAYVPLGHDAAIAGDYTDMKFKNNTEYPIYVEAYAVDGKLVTSIYGHETRSAGRTVELETVYMSSIPKPAEKVTENPELPEGERIVTYEGKVGHKVSTYKLVYENGKLLSREWFSDSVYKPVADEVSVGTKIADEVDVTGESIAGENGNIVSENGNDFDTASTQGGVTVQGSGSIFE